MGNKDLTITTNEGKEMYVIDSREVAEMMGRTHSDIMKMIQGSGKNLGIIPILTKGNFHVVDYFIESSYRDAKGEERKCYLCTKMGCEMLGNKQQGEKGILFTAKYVERFNEYEKRLKNIGNSLDTLKGLALLKIAEGKSAEERVSGATEYASLVSKPLIDKIEEDKPKVTYYDDVLDTKSSMTTTQVAKSFGMTSHKLNTYLSDKGIQFKKSGMWNLYKEYDGKGYTEVRTYVNKKKETTSHYLVWTEKGKEFIYNLLLEDKMIK
jgi:Rha family phage regulatory protein